jgi:hypothetical protein
MIRILYVLLIILQPLISFSQRTVKKDYVYPENMKLKKSAYQLKQNKADSIKYYANDKKFNLLHDPLSHLDNVGFRFIVRELDMNNVKRRHQTDSVQDAVNTLLQYVKNDSIRNMVYYLKEYIETRKTEEALRKVKKKMELDKILSYQPDVSKPEELDTDDAWKTHALEELFSYVENDPVHQWIREISRDSVLLGVKNYQNDSIKFWINNGKQDFKRFWLKKNKRDSIGIWVQNTDDRSVRILVDDDVYQQSVQKSKMRGTSVKLVEKISSDQYKLAKLGKYKRYSRKWNVGAIIGLSFNQGHVSDSWSRGGESSIATTSMLSAFANYNYNNHTWDNKIDLKYGLLKSGDNGFRKNEDRIELETKYGQKAVRKWYYSALFNLKTQAVKGYVYTNNTERKLKSDFFAPAYIIASVGMDYKPNKDLSILLSPIAAKYTIVRDTSLIDQTAFGLAKDEKVKKEIGSYVNVYHKLKFWGDLSLENKLTLYSNYSMKPKNVDINWELIFVMPINQYLSTKLSTYLISDDDTGSKVQFKENLEVGVMYRF